MYLLSETEEALTTDCNDGGYAGDQSGFYLFILFYHFYLYPQKDGNGRGNTYCIIPYTIC